VWPLLGQRALRRVVRNWADGRELSLRSTPWNAYRHIWLR
jgi:hypothetical protein